MKDKFAEFILTIVDWIMDHFTSGAWSSRQGDEIAPWVK